MQRFTTALRAAPRQLNRQYSVATAKSGAGGNEFLEARQAQKEHAGGSSDLWRKLSYYVALPLVVVTYVNTRNMENEHAEHKKHELEANGGEEEERILYPYMNKRDKEYPWGNFTLFFNPHVNIPPPGEEE